MKLSLLQFMEAYRVLYCQGSHIFQKAGSQMATKLTALRVGRSLPSRNIPDTHFCWRRTQPQSHKAAGRIRLIEKKNIDFIGKQ
jgi:hypothetical protein